MLIKQYGLVNNTDNLEKIIKIRKEILDICGDQL
jgi:hypothetical protein